MIDSLKPDELRKLSSIASKVLSPSEIERIKSSAKTTNYSSKQKESYDSTPGEFTYNTL